MYDKNVIEAWRNTDLSREPYCLNEDIKQMNQSDHYEDIFSYEDLVKRLGEVKRAPQKVHLNLLPIPYIGNIEKAKVIILSANPGLGATDYKIDDEDDSYRKILMNNLKQESFDDFPFFCLNPQYAWHGGFDYWEPRFWPIIVQLIEKKSLNYYGALREISNLIAVIEYIPYHSISSPVFRGLESTRMMKEYVHKVLLSRARNGQIDIIVTRKAKEWGLSNEKHVIVYSSGQARSASLGIESDGGKRILKYFGICKEICVSL